MENKAKVQRIPAVEQKENVTITIEQLQEWGWPVHNRPMTKEEFIRFYQFHSLLNTNDGDVRRFFGQALRLIDFINKQQMEEDWRDYEAQHRTV